MATTEHFYAGTGTQTSFPFEFPYLTESDVFVELYNSSTGNFDLKQLNTSGQNNDYSISNTNIVFNTAPPQIAGIDNIHIYRNTDVETAKAVYGTGSAIRAQDLNENTNQSLYKLQEGAQLINTDDIKDEAINSAKIKDGTIVNVDISPNAEIAVNKLANGTARQLLQTAANGTDVEFTSNVDVPGTLDVTGTATFDGNVNTVGTTTTNLLNSGNATLSGTLDVANLITTTTGLASNNVRVAVTAGNEIDTSTGGLTIDSASGTTTVDDNLVVTGSITAPLWNGASLDQFWLTNKQTIDHIGETITLGKSSTGTGSSFQVNNAAHSFNIAKNYTFNVGKYVNEGQTFGNFNGLSYQPCFQVKHLINQQRVIKTGSSYSVSNFDEKGYINLGTGQSSWINSNTNLHNTQVLHSNLVLSAIRGNSSSNAISNPNNYCPTVVLHPQRGVMFTHPDNVSETYTYSSDPNYVYSALNSVANGAYTQGTQFLGDPVGWGGNPAGSLDASECLTRLEAAVDFQIIVGGARAKNRFEIGSSSVAGTLSLSGTDVTATSLELNKLDGYTGTTTELNKLDGFTGTTTDLNEVVTGKNVVETITGSATDAQLPTAQAVNERIVELVTEVGGFHPIADEVSFPTTNPDINDGAGTIVSIANAAGLKVADGSGSGTYAGTAGNSIGATTTAGTAVTITGIDSSLHGTTIAGKGMLVETTSTLNEYTYHRLVVDEAGVASAQAAIDDFDERYYGPHAANQATRPSGANRQNGDLYFNTSDGKMKVFNGVHATGTWDDVAAPGNFFINTLSSSGSSTDTPPGGSATFNGTARKFTLSNPPLTAQQLLVSVNGVIQKPNSGTSPSEGFAINGADIIFASAPATSAPFFIVTIGSSVNIGTPSDGTVTTVKLDGGAVTDAKVSSTAGILGTKISPSFGSQNVQTSGSITVDGSTADTIIKNTGIEIEFTRAGANYINASNASGSLQLFTANSPRLTIASNGTTSILNSSGNTILELQRTDANTTGAHGTINFTASDGHSVASIGTLGDGDNEGADLVFRTTSAAASNDPFNAATPVNMTLDSSGQLGVGVASPSGPLHVYKSSGASRSYYESGDSHTFIRLLGGSTSHNSGLEFFSGSSTNTANITALSTGSLVFDTGSTNDAVTIDTYGRLLIGNTTAANSGADDLVIEETGHSVGITLRTSTTANGNIYFSDGTSGSDEFRGFIQYLHATNKFNIGTNATDRVTIDANGHINILDGNLAVASGHGIDFSAVSDGSRSVDSNLFSDYEEGTFTPAITAAGTGTDPTQTYTNQYGYYVKVGRIVTISVDVIFASSGISGGTGEAILSNLPFIKQNSTQHYGLPMAVGYSPTWGSTSCPTGGYMNPAQNWLYLMPYDSSVGTTFSLASHVGNQTRLIAGITYMTNS